MTSAPRPLVTVLLPVHNGGQYLATALESIVKQTYSELEILLLDDGSTDGAVEQLEAIGLDARIRVLRHANRGLAATLNRGIDEARGSLIARMDADDVAVPDRIQHQVAAFDDPEIVLVGGQLRRLVGDDLGRPTRFPVRHDQIVRGLMRRQHVLSHPAVVFRTSTARDIGGYWEHGPAEDWDLFLRMAERGRVVNIPDVVLAYRFHATGINAQSLGLVRRNMALATINHGRRAGGSAPIGPGDLDSARWAAARLLAAAETRSLSHYRRALQAKARGSRGTAAVDALLSAVWWPAQAWRRIRAR